MSNRKHTIYIDESGIANLAEYKARYFILSAITIEHKADLELSAYFNFIKRKYGVPEDQIFHAVDFFEIRTSSLYLSNKKCQKFVESVAEFLKIAPFEIRIVAIDKKELREILKLPFGYKFRGSRAHKEDKEVGYELAARQIFFDFARILKRDKSFGAIVAESRRGSDDVLLRTFLAVQEAVNFQNNRTLFNLSTTMKDRAVSICFENKHGLRGGLEMTDLISYVAYQKLNRRLSTFKKRGLEVLWDALQQKVVKNKIEVIHKNTLKKLAPDRIHKISERVRVRLAEFSDLVNPTLR